MSDEVARAVGAGASITVDGKDYRFRPISLVQLQEVQRKCLAYYKRLFLSTYTDNADLLGDRAEAMLEKKMDEASRWDIGDLPAKYSYDVSRIRVTPKLEDWIREKFGEVPETEPGKKAVVSACLDSGDLTTEEVVQKTGKEPKKFRIPYDAWWVTSVYEGMLTLVGEGVDDPSADVRQWPLPKIMEAAKIVERITAPAVGNT